MVHRTFRSASRHYFALGLALLAVAYAEAAQAKAGTVRLKNGGWVEGDVMVVVPDQEVVVRLADGTVRTLAWADVERVDETLAASASTPAAAAAASEERERPVAAAPPFQIPGISLDLFGFFALGGGISESEQDARFGTVTTSTRDLAPTYGAGAQLNYAFNNVFGLGVLGQYTSWRAEGASHRNDFLDAALVPRVQFTFNVHGTAVAVFVQAPIGIGWVNPDDTDVTNLKWKTSPAAVFGFNLGIEVFVSPRFGSFFSMGWSHHAFKLETETDPSPFTADLSTVKNDIQFQQMMFQLGLSYALSHL